MTTMTEHQPGAPARKRSGSGRRRRTAAAFVRLLPAELEAIEVRAKAAGRPVAGYLRDCALADPAVSLAADRGAQIDAAVSGSDDTSRVLPSALVSARGHSGASPSFDRESIREMVRAVIADFARQPGPALRDRITDVLWPLVNRAAEAEARLLEYENAITWDTSCTSCARVLDSAYAETCRREQAEATLAAIAERCGDKRLVLAADILAIIGGGEGADRGDRS